MDVADRIFRYYTSAGAAMLGLMALWMTSTPANAADAYSENAVKAAYLYRFAGYVHWPDEMPDNASFTIAVLGSPGVARELRHLLPGHQINNRVAQVREITGQQDLGKPQILYVGTGHADFLRALPPAAGLPSTLLVTDEDGGLNAGAALNFLMVDRRVRFEISLTAADRSGLKISSELLGVAVRVLGGGRQSRDGCSPFNSVDPADGGCSIRVARRGAGRGLPNHRRYLG